MSATSAKTQRRTVASRNGQTAAQAKRAARAKKSPPAPPTMEHPGVLVLRIPMPDGNFELQIACMNGMDPFAVPTILRKAIQIHERNLGLPEGS